MADLRWCPTQFQRYVPGVDHRVHVVGEEVFTCEILSGADDYRYPASASDAARMRTVVLPDDVAERCRVMARGMDLAVAGIDLRRTPDGEWFCFEVNPSPGFTFFEAATGLPIAAAIARLLMRADAAR